MRRSLNTQHVILTAVSFILFSIVIGCGSNADLATQISGKWKPAQGDGIVDINLAKEPKSMTIDGRAFNAFVENLDKGSNTVKVKVETEAGKTEVWSIHQVWNDNGSTFKLKFRRNGTTETLESVVNS